jgi:hypothetical protein
MYTNSFWRGRFDRAGQGSRGLSPGGALLPSGLFPLLFSKGVVTVRTTRSWYIFLSVPRRVGEKTWFHWSFPFGFMKLK